METVLDPLAYDIALSQTLLSGAVLQRLVVNLGSAQAVWEASSAQLKPLLKDTQLERLIALRETYHLEYGLTALHQCNITPITVSHMHYPPLLKQIHDPPYVLYVRGNPAALIDPAPLAIVGTREFSAYGERVVSELIRQIVPYQPTIISGLAAGIDTLAHQAALQYDLPTVAVFGTGIDKIFPAENKRLAQQILESGGALISEFPLGFPGGKHTFPLRNRIIAGMSGGTLVIEGNAKSGSMITARCALSENRQVMAVPGNLFDVGSQGPHILIHEGAMLVQTGTDIAHAMGWQSSATGGAAQTEAQVEAETPLSESAPDSALESLESILSTDEMTVFQAIPVEGLMSTEGLHHQLETLPLTTLHAALTMLELHGLIHALPGGQFARNR